MIRAYYILAVFITLFGVNHTVKAQDGNYYADGKGSIIKADSYTEIVGEPYLFNYWAQGGVIAADSKVYSNIQLKYDVYADMPIFIYNNTDEPQKFASAVKSFVLLEPKKLTFSNGFPAIDKQSNLSYYQILATGKVALLKRLTKVVTQSKGYGTSTIVRRFDDSETYYIFKAGKMASINKNKNSIVQATADKGNQIEAYIKTVNINFKKDDDLSKLFDYYNSL